MDVGASPDAGVVPVGRGFASEVTAVAVLALHNLAVHRLLSSPADAALNLVTAAGLTAFARRAGCSHDDLGIRAADAAAGLRLGLAAGGARKKRVTSRKRARASRLQTASRR
jgi:hypothetical protein